MEMRQVIVKNFHLVSYNRFNSREDNDDNDEDNLANQSIRNISSGCNTSGSRYYRLSAVCLTLLCVLLISAVSVLWVKFNNLTTKNTDLQTHYSNLILEKEQLQTSYENLTFERNQLQIMYSNLNRDKDQLQASYNNLTVERDRLQTSYNNLTVERDRLQTSYNNLTVERDRLQTSYNKLSVERDQLQTSYNNLTIERDRLQTSYNNLITVRDQDQAKCKELANEMAKLQTNYSTMANQKDQLQKEKDEIQNRLREIAAQAKLGWVYFSFGLYFISTEKKSWTEARADCRKKGADLVIIKTKEEEEVLVKQLGNDKAWIGLNDRPVEGTWKWVDGTALTTAYWVPGEPNDSGNEDCAELWGLLDKQGWNDRPCNDRVRWICEKPFRTSQW
ncbi:hypothetical protein PGIGA_G00031870 [Pangasianodon gigas]|uniref:Uncharacterized protein n=1 Tax=Pangasianodon gigas TaxID=30993 RepID=A0ACC5WXU6_PANGG|nr:hypothetical protein [Pangasianodon gigas]